MMTKAGMSSGGIKIQKEEEEEAALASKGHHRKQRKKKKDLSKVRCFKCGELEHFATQCHQKKSEDKSDSKAAASKDDDGDDDDVAMSAHVPREKRWGDIDL